MRRQTRTICCMIAANVALPAYGFLLARGSAWFITAAPVLALLGWGIGAGIELKPDASDRRAPSPGAPDNG